MLNSFKKHITLDRVSDKSHCQIANEENIIDNNKCANYLIHSRKRKLKFVLFLLFTHGLLSSSLLWSQRFGRSAPQSSSGLFDSGNLGLNPLLNLHWSIVSFLLPYLGISHPIARRFSNESKSALLGQVTELTINMLPNFSN